MRPAALSTRHQGTSASSGSAERAQPTVRAAPGRPASRAAGGAGGGRRRGGGGAGGPPGGRGHEAVRGDAALGNVAHYSIDAVIERIHVPSALVQVSSRSARSDWRPGR